MVFVELLVEASVFSSIFLYDFVVLEFRGGRFYQLSPPVLSMKIFDSAMEVEEKIRRNSQPG